jgi:lipopolysaccharide export system permease protein
MVRNCYAPAVTILSRQFLASYLRLYAAILLASILVVVIIEMMLNLDDALEYQQGARGIATYLFLRVPSYYLPYLVPVASFAAAFLCLGLPARAHEIVALKAGGVAPQRVCVPVLVAAAMLSAASLLLNETIVRDTSSEFNRREEQGDMDTIFQSRGGFWYHHGTSFFNVDGADPDARSIEGIRVYRLDDGGRLVQTVSAESAIVDEQDRWLLRNATFRTFGPDPAAAPEVRREEEAVLEMASDRELALLNADATNLNLLRLGEYIEAADREGRDPSRYRALFHSRLADPFSVLVFALLAIPVGLAVERSRSLAASAVQGIVIVTLFYTLQAAGALVASGGVSAAALVPWLALLLFGGYGAWRFARLPA